MNDYREIRIDISPCSEDGTDIMAYLLAEVGFESFVPDEKGLTAYIRVEDYDVKKVNDALAQYPFAAALNLSSQVIEGRDWNSEWEKNYFQPILVDNRCVIHSTFHTHVPRAQYDIVIDPKMAFGTGHHATTSQVIKALLAIEPVGQTVIDMGTGTGILAILAAMLGASHVYGVEIDAFAYTNALENIELNGVGDKVTIMNGDVSALKNCPECDVFLANINRNVIVADLPTYVKALKPGAKMILSGFYEKDIPYILEVAEPLGLTLSSQTVQNEWACITLKFQEK